MRIVSCACAADENAAAATRIAPAVLANRVIGLLVAVAITRPIRMGCLLNAEGGSLRKPIRSHKINLLAGVLPVSQRCGAPSPPAYRTGFAILGIRQAYRSPIG